MQHAARDTASPEMREQVLAWVREALEDPGVELTDNFLDVGGHSLAAARVNKQLEQEYGLRMSLQTRFEATLTQACDQASAVPALPGTHPSRSSSIPERVAMTASPESFRLTPEKLDSFHRNGFIGPLDVYANASGKPQLLWPGETEDEFGRGTLTVWTAFTDSTRRTAACS